jgi:hypothetical protein
MWAASAAQTRKYTPLAAGRAPIGRLQFTFPSFNGPKASVKYYQTTNFTQITKFGQPQNQAIFVPFVFFVDKNCAQIPLWMHIDERGQTAHMPFVRVCRCSAI